MRFLLLVAVCCLAVFASAEDKKKRDILPGDPRYGTDYHRKHHNTHNKNELEVARSQGGYVGSYTVSEVNTAYGPPDYQPAKPINNGQLGTVVENNVDVSSNYGVPERTEQHHEAVHEDYRLPSTGAPVTSYGSPVTVETKTAEKDVHPTVAYGVPAVRGVVSAPAEEKVETTVVRTTSTIVPEDKSHEHLQQKTVQKTDVKTGLPLPTASGVVVNAPAIDARFLNTNVGSYPSADLSSFSHAGSLSFSGDQAFAQPQPVNFQTAYDLQGNNQQFESQYSNYYGNQYLSPGSYDASLSQAYQVPQTLYTQQTYSPVSSQYAYPYPLRHSSVYETGLGANQKAGPIVDFFQENFPNLQLPQLPQLPQLQLPQLPQLPQFPNLSSFFQQPTQPAVTAPADATVVDVKKNVEQKVSEVSDKHTVKHVPISVDNAAKKETTVYTKTTKEYTQPIDSNGGYIY